MIQYPGREEGATQLYGNQTTDQVSTTTKATFDFDGEADELSFNKGDEITVTEYKVGESFDWAKGHKINDPTKIGIFPKNHTTLIASDERDAFESCGNLKIPQGATYYIDKEKEWFAKKDDDRITGEVEPRVDGEKAINYYYNHITDKTTYDSKDGTCDTKKETVEGRPNWYKEVETGRVIFRKYKRKVLEREQKNYPEIWDNFGKSNLVNQTTAA